MATVRPCQWVPRHGLRLCLVPRQATLETRGRDLRMVGTVPLARDLCPRPPARTLTSLWQALARIRRWKSKKILLSGEALALIGHGSRSSRIFPVGLRCPLRLEEELLMGHTLRLLRISLLGLSCGHLGLFSSPPRMGWLGRLTLPFPRAQLSCRIPLRSCRRPLMSSMHRLPPRGRGPLHRLSPHGRVPPPSFLPPMQPRAPSCHLLHQQPGRR